MIIRKTMQQASYLSCRESISKDILASCGIPPEKIDVICDAGFATYSCSQEKTSELLEKYNLSKSNYIAVTARPWFQKEISKGNRSHYDNYVKTMASLCDYLVHDKNKNIALIVQNDGAHSINEPDIVPLQDIFNKMSYSDSAIILDDDFTFDELTSLYENAFITIGTRLHSCIFSLSAATPAIAVAYAHKAQGIMTMLDASEFILDIENPSVSKGKGLIEKLSSEHDVLSEKYRKKTQILCDEIYSIMQKIISKNLNAKK
jgi:colanic acid/amylovoran biosynthesis protein